jgi:hypothetical protein
MQWCTISTAVTCCAPRVDSLGYVRYPGNPYLLEGAVWTGASSRRWVQCRGRILSPQITIGSVSSSSEVGISRE